LPSDTFERIDHAKPNNDLSCRAQDGLGGQITTNERSAWSALVGFENDRIADTRIAADSGPGFEFDRFTSAENNWGNSPRFEGVANANDDVVAVKEHDIDGEPHQEHVHPHEWFEASPHEEHAVIWLKTFATE
jgi:hypothetical protein